MNGSERPRPTERAAAGLWRNLSYLVRSDLEMFSCTRRYVGVFSPDEYVWFRPWGRELGCKGVPLPLARQRASFKKLLTSFCLRGRLIYERKPEFWAFKVRLSPGDAPNRQPMYSMVHAYGAHCQMAAPFLSRSFGIGGLKYGNAN